MIRSRIHRPGCPWNWSSEAIEHLAALRRADEWACEILEAKARRAFLHGIPADENGEHDEPHHQSHRCPVGGRVPELNGCLFDSERPLPWAGELYASSEDERTLYRLYFIEGRQAWTAETSLIVGSGVGQKPVDEMTAWCADDQTGDIHDAMDSGVTYCTNTGRRWRRWNTT